MKILDVVKAKYVSGYKILISFSDKTERLVDFSKFLKESHHPEIRKYLSLKLFRKFKIVHGNLDWNDLDLCFPVSDLYEGNIEGVIDEQKSA